jgi:hypothetical protein
MNERLVVLEAPGDLVPLPQPRELRAHLLQPAHQVACPRACPHRPVGGAQVGDQGAALPVPVLLWVAQPCRRVGEPAVDVAAGQARVPGSDAEQCLGHLIGHQRLPQAGQDQRGGVGQPVKDAQQRRDDMRRGRGRRWSVVPGEPVQVVAFVAGQPERPGERGKHLLTRLRAAPLLQPGVIVGGHHGQGRDLLAAKPLRAATYTRGKAHVHGPQRLPAVPQEVRQSYSVHTFSIGHQARAKQGSPIPR